MKKQLLQLAAGGLTAFVITAGIYYLFQREGGLFSGMIVAAFTCLGIMLGQKTSS